MVQGRECGGVRQGRMSQWWRSRVGEQEEREEMRDEKEVRKKTRKMGRTGRGGRDELRTRMPNTS